MSGTKESQMDFKDLTPGRPIVLTGDAMARGHGQAALEPQMVAEVVNAVMGRIKTADDSLSYATDFLSAQWRFMDEWAPGQMAQVQGIASGYVIKADDLFAYLHMGMIEDASAMPAAEEDGCSVVALSSEDAGPVLAKNRDYRGEHRALQRVFLESDPAWGGRRILSVGSLGSPGAFSSGMNSDGLALADTRIGWQQPGIGWLRYLLMNEVLIRAGTVEEALTFIRSQQHAGGGSLVLMDAAGYAVTVELGSGRINSRVAGLRGIGQTNHYLAPELWAGQTLSPIDPEASNSRGRLAIIENLIKDREFERPALGDITSLMAFHADNDHPSLCRHGIADGSETISTSIFACASRMLYFCPGNPCKDEWVQYAF